MQVSNWMQEKLCWSQRNLNHHRAWLPRQGPRQSKGKGIRSQMVGLHVAVDIDYHLQSAKTHLLCQQIDISEPKCVHQKQTQILRCHRDTNCLSWSSAPVHPCCRYGQIWYPLPMYDPMRGWSSRRDMLAWSMARNSECLESVFALRPPESKWNSTTTIP